MQKPFKLLVSVAWWIQLFYIVPFTALSIFTLVAVFQGSEDALCGLLMFAGPFTLLGWALALYRIQITEESVTVKTFYGHFRIAWDEVEKIVLNRNLIALLGNDKRLVLSPGSTSKNVKAMVAFINQEIERRNIKVETNVHLPTSQHSTRVWR